MNSSSAHHLPADNHQPGSPSLEDYRDAFPDFLAEHQARNPLWWAEALTAIILCGLEDWRDRPEVASGRERLSGEPLLHSWHYAVGWDWDQPDTDDRRTVQRPIGGFTRENTATKELAWQRMNELIARHGCVTVLSALTKGVWFEHRDNFSTPFLSPEHSAQLEAIPDAAARQACYEEIVRPFCIGAEPFDIDAWGRAGPNPPAGGPEGLPNVTFTGHVNGRKVKLGLVFVLQPLVADYLRQEAYHELTVGLFPVPEATASDEAAPTRANLADWTPEERETLWQGLLEQVDRHLPDELAKMFGMEVPPAATPDSGIPPA